MNVEHFRVHQTNIRVYETNQRVQKSIKYLAMPFSFVE